MDDGTVIQKQITSLFLSDECYVMGKNGSPESPKPLVRILLFTALLIIFILGVKITGKLG